MFELFLITQFRPLSERCMQLNMFYDCINMSFTKLLSKLLILRKCFGCTSDTKKIVKELKTRLVNLNHSTFRSYVLGMGFFTS